MARLGSVVVTDLSPRRRPSPHPSSSSPSSITAKQASQVLEETVLEGASWIVDRHPGDSARIAHDIVASGYRRPPLGQAIDNAAKRLRKNGVHDNASNLVRVLLEHGYSRQAKVDDVLKKLKEERSLDALAPQPGRVIRAVLVPASTAKPPRDVHLTLEAGRHILDTAMDALSTTRAAALAIVDTVRVQGVSTTERTDDACIDAKMYSVINNASPPSSMPVNRRASFLASRDNEHVVVRGDVLIFAASAWKVNGMLRTSAVTCASVRRSILRLAPSRLYLSVGLGDEQEWIGSRLHEELLLPLKYRPGWLAGQSAKSLFRMVVKTKRVAMKLGIDVEIRELPRRDRDEWHRFEIELRALGATAERCARVEKVKVHRKVRDLGEHAPQLVALHLIEEAVRTLTPDAPRLDGEKNAHNRLTSYTRDDEGFIEEGGPHFDHVDVGDAGDGRPVFGAAVKVALLLQGGGKSATGGGGKSRRVYLSFVVGDGSLPKPIDFGVRDRRPGDMFVVPAYGDLRVDLLELKTFRFDLQRKLGARRQAASARLFEQPLASERHRKACEVISDKGATAVVDIGCGSDVRLFLQLLSKPADGVRRTSPSAGISRIVGVDTDRSALVDYTWQQCARARLQSFIHRRRRRREHEARERQEEEGAESPDARDDDAASNGAAPVDDLPAMQLLHGRANALTREALHVTDDTLAVAIIEVIEHLERTDAERLLDDVLHRLQPDVVFVSTPNSEWNEYIARHVGPYNPNADNPAAGGSEAEPSGYRHWDHKWEATDAEFRALMTNRIASTSYDVEFTGVGSLICVDGASPRGFPTQIAILTLRAQAGEPKRRRLDATSSPPCVITTLEQKQKKRDAHASGSATNGEAGTHTHRQEQQNHDGNDAALTNTEKKKKKRRRKKKNMEGADATTEATIEGVDQVDSGELDVYLEEVYLYPPPPPQS